MSPLEIAEKIARDHDCRSARRWPIVEDIRRAIEAAKAPILWCCHVRGRHLKTISSETLRRGRAFGG